MHIARFLSEEGFTQQQIATRLGVSDRMVRKYLRTDYQIKIRKPKVSQLDPYKPLIESIIEDRPFFNLVILADDLRARGYQGGMSILRDYAAKIRQQALTKAVIRFETEPGRQAQVDWKECGRWLVAGKAQKVYAFVMLLGFSRKPFVLFTTAMTSSVLLAAHNQAFGFFEGVPHEILYDNMRTAWIADGSDWKMNSSLRDYSAQVGFEPKRCQVRRPQTKGKVERFIGYLGNHFLPKAREQGLETIEELNAAIGPWLCEVDQESLREFCETRGQRFEQEKPHLRPWIAQRAPDVRLNVDVIVSREGLISYETNRYSVPAQYLGRQLTLKVDVLARTGELIHEGVSLRTIELSVSGRRHKQVDPEDAKSLLERWKKENRRKGISQNSLPSPPPSSAVSQVEVETRAPSYYDKMAQVSA